ncbi:MAG: hypothetical protein HY403_11035 [Elusimicrobia bacterium]|nr:hypothetical protein [Elusimicrobiota bacterium]
MKKSPMIAAALVLAVSAVFVNADSSRTEDQAAQAGTRFAADMAAGVGQVKKGPAVGAPASKPIQVAGLFDDLLGGGRSAGRGETCGAYDDGWEEHRAHRSCSECLSVHGSCNYQCTVTVYSCVAQWVNNSGVAGGRYSGRDMDDRWEAERSAISRCQDDNWNNRESGRCQITENCRESQRTTTSYACRR